MDIEKKQSWFGKSIAWLKKAMQPMKSTEAYQDAIVLLENSPQAQHILGTPIQVGATKQAEMSTAGDGSGWMRMVASVSGSSESGRFFIEASRHEKQWIHHVVGIKTRSGHSIDLLNTTHGEQNDEQS